VWTSKFQVPDTVDPCLDRLIKLSFSGDGLTTANAFVHGVDNRTAAVGVVHLTPLGEGAVPAPIVRQLIPVPYPVMDRVEASSASAPDRGADLRS